MKRHFKIMLSVALCLGLIFGLSSCIDSQAYEDAYFDGYEDGRFDASSEFRSHSFEMYLNGYDEAYRDFADTVFSDYAIWYAREFSEYHPEEAMCIIDCYERGERYCGQLPITEEDYKDAIESLYRYYEYFLNGMYKDDIDCGCDFYYRK